MLGIRELKGLEFEKAVSDELKRMGFTKLTKPRKARNYIKGASGATHEIDICAFNRKSKELLMGECKTGRLVRYSDVLKFIAKSQDIIDGLDEKISPAKITKILIATNDFDPNGYRICWYYGIIPFQCSNPVPIFLAPQIIKDQVTELEKSDVVTVTLKEEIKESAFQIIDRTKTFMLNAGVGKQYDLKLDKSLRSEIYDIYNTLVGTQKTLRQLQELGYNISDYLANLIMSGDILSRQSYVATKSELLQRFDLARESLSDYEMVKILSEKPCEPNKIETVLPYQYHCVKVAKKIVSQAIRSAKEFRKLVVQTEEKVGKRLHYYRIMRAAFETMKDIEVETFVRFYVENLKIPNKELLYVACRHILKELMGRRILTKQDLKSNIERTNKIFGFPQPLRPIDLVRYAKSEELREALINHYPYESASRSVADLIILQKIRSRRDFNIVRAETMDLYWLDRRPSYNSILDSSPVTYLTQKFFRKHGIFVKPRIQSNHKELVKIDEDLKELANTLVLRRITKGNLCKACGKRIAGRFVKIALKPTLVCDECYDLFSKIK